MGSKWPVLKFKDLYLVPSRNGLTKPKAVRGAGYKFINMGEIFSYGRMFNIPCDRVQLTEKEKQTSLLMQGDLLFARQSLVLSGAGKCSIFLGDDEDVAFESHLIRVRLDTELVNPEYLYYYFLSPQGRKNISTIVEQGAGQAGIRGSDLENLDVPVPPKKYQDNLVSIINNFDTKCECNYTINQTLEQMAQTLFKSWFVDFDPVIDNALDASNDIPDTLQERAEQRRLLRAKADFKPLPAETRALFPSEFEETELGWVPKGWEVCSLPELFDFKEGPGIRNWQYTNSDAGTKFINIRCIQDGDITLTTANRISDEEANGKYLHFHLEEWDIVLSASGTLGRCAIVRREHLPLILNTSVIRFRPIEKKSKFCFIYGYIQSHEFQFTLESMACGSVQKNFGPMHLKQIRMLAPSYKVLSKYDNSIKPLFTKMLTLRSQIDSLIATRDSLLPKLISGELALDDLPEDVAEAAEAV